MLAWLLPLGSPGWSLVICTTELSAGLSQSPAQGSVAASPAPGAVSCRRHDGAIESAGSGLSILQRRRSSRGPPAAASAPRFLSSQHGLGPSRGLPAAAPVPRFPSAGTSCSYVRFPDSPAPEPALVMSPAAAPALRSSGTVPSRGTPAAGPASLSPAPDLVAGAGCRPGSSIPSTGSSCEPTYNRRVVSGHQSVSKRRSASGGRRPS